MRKWIIPVLAVLIVLVSWQAASPWMAMDTLRDAAREGDQEDLADAVDFPALRASVKSELREEIVEEGRGRGVAGLLPLVLIDRVVDRVVTPEGLSALLVSGRVLRDGNPDVTDKEIDWHVRWTDLGSFRAVPDVGDGKVHPSLIFKRDGLSWNLVGIDIPDRPPHSA
jgi:hypothetical protein